MNRSNYWAKYVEDLKTVAVFNSSERALAQAMVWNHMAGLHRDLAADLADGDGPFGLPAFRGLRSGHDSAEVKRAKKHVIECLEQEPRACPRPPADLPVAGRGLSGLGRYGQSRSRRAAGCWRSSPKTSIPSRSWPSSTCEKNEPAAALPLVQKARALKPLDESLRELEWTIRIGLARIHALAKQWDAGRDEFKAAEQLLPDCRNQYSYLARRVIFEAKASQARAKRPVSRAGAGEPERPDTTLARALDRVHPLPHDESHPEGLRPALGVGAQEQMHERDGRRDGLAHGRVLERRN